MRRPIPRRDQAYFYWAIVGPLGAHAFYCGRKAWGALELALALAGALFFLFARLDFEPLARAALLADPIVFERPWSLIKVGAPSWLSPCAIAWGLNTFCWALDAYLIRRWTAGQRPERERA